MSASFTLPPETRTAVVVNGRLTAVYPPRPYRREIRELVVECTVSSRVDVYRAIMSPIARIASNPIGANNTLNPVNRQTIPPGQQVFVRWEDAAAGVAIATITFEGFA